MGQYDLVVVGGGSAGLTAAIVAGQVGARVLLVDRERLGGDCTHHGCIPSKALIRCAKVAHTARHGQRFGVKAAGVEIDFPRAMAHVHECIATIERGETPQVLQDKGVEVAFGGARFLSPHRMAVGDREVETKNVILAVGSRAVAPAIHGLEETGYLDHVSLFELQKLPQRLVVIGGGPIGVEMGQALARLGAAVTILEGHSHILRRDDPELTELLRQHLAEELTVLCDTEVVRVGRDGDAKYVSVVRDGEHSRVACDEILVAVGRKPSLEDLALDQAGVAYNERGIVVDRGLRTSASSIWACGDCVGQFQFTHFAEAQARVAARNALFMGNSGFDPPVVPWTTFADPELAHVGSTEAQARRQREQVHVYRYAYEDLDRAICEGETVGLAKVVCDRRDRILGASLLGPHAGESLAEIAVAMHEGLSLPKLTNIIHAYPTMTRIVRRIGDERFYERGVSSFTKKVFGTFKGTDEETFAD